MRRIMLLVTVGTMMAAILAASSPAFAALGDKSAGGSGVHCDEAGFNCTGGGAG
jgi:hypothetical protein